MGVLARNQITIANIKDGKPSYTYVRYSDDGGKTFTAEVPFKETYKVEDIELCPAADKFVLGWLEQNWYKGKTLEEVSYTSYKNAIMMTELIPCKDAILSYNMKAGYSIWVLFFDENGRAFNRLNYWAYGMGHIGNIGQSYIALMLSKRGTSNITDVAAFLKDSELTIKIHTRDLDYWRGRNLVLKSLQPIFVQNSVGTGTSKVMEDETGPFTRVTAADGKTLNCYTRGYRGIETAGFACSMEFRPEKDTVIWNQPIKAGVWTRVEQNELHEGNMYLGFKCDCQVCDVRKFKLEYGLAATPWTPAPEDQQFGTTPGKYAGMAVSDTPYPPLNVSDYTWTKMEGHDGRGISSIKRFYGVSTSETKEPAAYSENRPTLSATNKYLWTYDLITFSDGTTQQTTHAVTGTYGDTGDPGKDGDAAYTISCSPSAAVFDTDEQGNIIADTSVTLKVMKGKAVVDVNGKMSVLSSTNFTKGETRVNGTVVTLAKKGVAMQSVSVGGETTTLPVTSGSVELQIAVDATTKLTYTVPFSVNVTKYMSSMYSDLKQFKRTFTEFKGTAANMESFRSEVEQTATNIGAAIYDALGEVGVKIKGKDRSVNIKAGVFKVETPLGDIPLIIENGKISMSLLDAKKIIAEGIKAQTIDAEQATFENLKVVDGEFSGDLKGVSGSFKTLRCVNDLGQEVGSIAFGSDGKIWFDGDLYHQGEVNGRTARFYTSSLWCRGSFGASNRNTLLVRNNRAYYYPDGTHKPAFEENLNMKTSDSGAQYYEIYCHSYFSGLIHGVAGMPIDTLIIVNANNSYTYELWMAETQRVMVINGNNSGHTEFNIYTNGNKTRWDPGEVAEVVQVPSSFMTPQVNKSVLGHGLIVGAFRNNDW